MRCLLFAALAATAAAECPTTTPHPDVKDRLIIEGGMCEYDPSSSASASAECEFSVSWPLGVEFLWNNCNPCKGESSTSGSPGTMYLITKIDATHIDWKSWSADDSSGSHEGYPMETNVCRDGQIEFKFGTLEDDGLGGGAIAGIIIGCLLLLALIAGGAFMYTKNKKLQASNANPNAGSAAYSPMANTQQL